MDTFMALPAPLLLIIIKSISDFPSLDSLIQSSPVMSSLFDECAAEIVESLFKHSNYSTYSRRLFAQAATIYTPSIRRTWSSAADCHCYLHERHPEDMLDETPFLFRGLSIPGLRRLIHAASNMDSLCHGFFRTHLDRVHALKPRHLIKPIYSMDPYAPRKYDLALAGPAYSIFDTGPPSWVETQRVLRAIWRLFVFLELRSIMPSLENVPGSQTRVGNLSLEEFWMDLSEWEIDEMECVHDYLLGIGTGTRLVRLPSVRCHNDASLVAPTPQEDTIGAKWGQSPKAPTFKSPGSLMFPVLCRPGPDTDTGALLLGGATWQSFRRLGFGIWDLKRMSRLEMMSPGHDQADIRPQSTDPSLTTRRFSMDDLKFTWMSIA